MNPSSSGGLPAAGVTRAKREFYSQTQIATTYDQLRFGGASGAWVNRRELAIVRRLLPPAGRALDLGCGTGRLAAELKAAGYQTYGLDPAAEMLRLTRARDAARAVQGDGFALPFRNSAFDVVVALRVVFHFPESGPLLGEMARVLRPGGVAVFDTYRWTPRALIALAAGRWGGKVYVHRAADLLAGAYAAGLEPARAEHCFLFSPYIYRRLPLRLVRLLDQVERIVPPRLRARTFWKFVRAGAEGA